MQAQIIIKPLLTEKSMTDVKIGKYSFVVAERATKLNVKHAVNDAFGVSVVSVTTSIVKGRTKRIGARRQEVDQSKWKKATVMLKRGQTIALFEPGAATEQEEVKKA
jgi:large subunit ribosomal protein L23